MKKIKIKKKLNINERLTPEINTVAIQLPISKIDCPRSGWSIKRIITEVNKRKLNKYLILEFWNLFKVNILTVAKIKNGFRSSIGWSLKKYKSNHLLAPFTSIPIIGTRKSRIKNNIKNGTIVFFNKEVSTAEIINIMKRASTVKIRCFEKKK